MAFIQKRFKAWGYEVSSPPRVHTSPHKAASVNRALPQQRFGHQQHFLNIKLDTRNTFFLKISALHQQRWTPGTLSV